MPHKHLLFRSEAREKVLRGAPQSERPRPSAQRREMGPQRVRKCVLLPGFVRQFPVQALAFTVLLASSTHVAAQPSPDVFEEVRPAQSTVDIRVGQTVWITTHDGGEQKGRIAAFTASRLDLEVSRQRVSYSMPDVLKIEARDSVWNGTRTGAIAGGVAGGVYFGLLAYSLRCETDCGPTYSVRRDVLETSLGLGAMSAAVGALSGALIDRAIEGRRLVYSSLPRSTVVGVAPFLGRGTVGIRAVVLLR
jgi:hypothetical protein